MADRPFLHEANFLASLSNADTGVDSSSLAAIGTTFPIATVTHAPVPQIPQEQLQLQFQQQQKQMLQPNQQSERNAPSGLSQVPSQPLDPRFAEGEIKQESQENLSTHKEQTPAESSEASNALAFSLTGSASGSSPTRHLPESQTDHAPPLLAAASLAPSSPSAAAIASVDSLTPSNTSKLSPDVKPDPSARPQPAPMSLEQQVLQQHQMQMQMRQNRLRQLQSSQQPSADQQATRQRPDYTGQIRPSAPPAHQQPQQLMPNWEEQRAAIAQHAQQQQVLHARIAQQQQQQLFQQQSLQHQQLLQQHQQLAQAPEMAMTQEQMQQQLAQLQQQHLLQQHQLQTHQLQQQRDREQGYKQLFLQQAQLQAQALAQLQQRQAAGLQPSALLPQPQLYASSPSTNVSPQTSNVTVSTMAPPSSYYMQTSQGYIHVAANGQQYLVHPTPLNATGSSPASHSGAGYRAQPYPTNSAARRGAASKRAPASSRQTPVPAQPRQGLYEATYSNVMVYEMASPNGVGVMRRRLDSWMNATHILKAAGMEKSRRTKVLEREIHQGEHEKIQGGYGKYQGTWIPLTRAKELAAEYGLGELLHDLLSLPETTP
ncbi:transcriptional regulator swi6, partial [Thoreauomyces humboldtii]